MTRFHLSTLHSPNKIEVRLNDNHGGARADVGVARCSHIYSVADNVPNPLSNGTGNVSFFFTADAFFAIGKAVASLPATDVSRIFLSHGVASIIFIWDDAAEFDRVRTTLEPYVIGYETWHINGGVLALDAVESTLAAPVAADGLAVPSGILDMADEALFLELSSSLKMARSYANSYLPAYRDLVEGVTLTAKFVLALLLRLCHPGSDEALAAANALPEAELANLEREMQSLKDALSILKRARAARDEAVQLSAILRNMNVQAFAGLPRILDSSYESGDFSLLGFGGAFLGYLALYRHTRGVFHDLALDTIVRKKFPDMAAPALQNGPTRYTEWRDTLRNFDGLEKKRPEESPDTTSEPAAPPPTPSETLQPAAYHLLYFSNRLGFRETKLSMSAAYLSLRFGATPSWTLFTFTHEFIHAHMRAFFSILLPMGSTAFKRAYDAYAERATAAPAPLKLDVFLAASMLEAAHRVRCLEAGAQRQADGTKKYAVFGILEQDELLTSLRSSYHLLNEIATSALDFNYFYGGDADLYIRSIWSSWLPLPIVFPRTFEYFLRTLTAIASTRSGDEDAKFRWAYETLTTSLTALKSSDWIETAAIDRVLSELVTLKSKLHTHFFIWCNYVDCIVEFLFSSRAETGLFSDPSAAEQPDRTFAYDLVPGRFEPRRIASPIQFLLDIKRKSLAPAAASAVDPQYATLWMFFALASALNTT